MFLFRADELLWTFYSKFIKHVITSNVLVKVKVKRERSNECDEAFQLTKVSLMSSKF